jgi:catechol 2,3-dioxygenase-like lactoylglutathione lyase family enzyme
VFPQRLVPLHVPVTAEDVIDQHIQPALVALDCPDPAALAAFYSKLPGQPITYQSDDWVVVAANGTSSGLAFQLAADHHPPTWPDPAVPQQFHLDVMVEDVASAEPRVLGLGARKLSGENVYADPAGHPFCIIPRPSWAPPILADGYDPASAETGEETPAGPRRPGPGEPVDTPGPTTARAPSARPNRTG